MDLNYDIFRIENENRAPRPGNVLISEPFSQDTYFKRSVVFLTEHTAQGSLGFILNNSLQLNIHEIIEDFPRYNGRISVGGPVSTDSIFYMHTLGSSVPNSIKIQDGLYWGGNFEILKILIQSGSVSKSQVRFFMGYSGWSPNQLADELNKNFWLISDLPIADIMNENVENLWKGSLEKMGRKYRVWSNFPENPEHN